jgi:hypothetical protein
MFKLFSKPTVAPVEKWAVHNAKKTTPDDLIAGAIVASFAKDFKHWQFVGQFEQKWGNESSFRSTSLSRKMGGKKHVEITFLFRHTKSPDGDYSHIHRYRAIGCEVNGIRVSELAFRRILNNWKTIVTQVRRAEEIAAGAKATMDANENKWNLAEALLGMKRNGLGQLMPVKTAEESAQ